MSRVVFHGILHLCGYNDKIELEIAQMRAKEDLYINHFVSRETK
jgi:ssRNA-specific RNase YbeY (16S rRNA maturation enzyme)